MTATLRAALVGYGSSGRGIHRPLITATEGLELGYVVTGAAERAAQVAQDLPSATIVAGLEALLDAHRPDVIVLASPNAAHAPNALAAIAAGIPVVVDKPFTADAASAWAVVDAAQAAGVPLTVFHNRRWDSEHLTLRRLLEQDALGRVLRYEARFERYRPVPKDRWRERLPSEQGGGLLLDLGSHLVDGAMQLFGPVSTVHAELDAVTTRADDVTFLSLQHANGVRSHLSATSVAGSPGPARRVLGTAGAYVVAGIDGEEPVSGRTWPDADADHRGWLFRGEEGESVPAVRVGWDAFYPAVVSWLRGSGPVPVDPSDAASVMDVLDAARSSAATGRTVAITPRSEA